LQKEKRDMAGDVDGGSELQVWTGHSICYGFRQIKGIRKSVREKERLVVEGGAQAHQSWQNR
jgi:hypothetical protein